MLSDSSTGWATPVYTIKKPKLLFDGGQLLCLQARTPAPTLTRQLGLGEDPLCSQQQHLSKRGLASSSGAG